MQVEGQQPQQVDEKGTWAAQASGSTSEAGAVVNQPPLVHLQLPPLRRPPPQLKHEQEQGQGPAQFQGQQQVQGKGQGQRPVLQEQQGKPWLGPGQLVRDCCVSGLC